MLVSLAPSEGTMREEHKMLQAAMRYATIVLHGPPDFAENAEILGVCGVSAENSIPNKYGWMVTDFLHWKLLFHTDNTGGSNAAHMWLSSLDIRDFLTRVGGVDVDKDENIHRVISDDDDKNKNIIKISNDNEDFVADFLKHVADRARAAVSKRTDLVLLVFSPVTSDGDICIDLSGTKYFLKTEEIYDTITQAVGNASLSVILLTPSPFTGGWLCRPWFTEIPICPPPEKMMRAIAESCGGAFAETFIRTFTQRSSPLMSESQRTKVTYDNPMPVNPTTQQTECLHALHRQIHESLEHRLQPLARKHGLIFQKTTATGSLDFHDPWVQYVDRRGRSMESWYSQWKAPRPEIDGAHRFEFLGEAFGGNKESQIFHLKYLAGIELQTYPGDWGVSAGSGAKDLLNNFKQQLNPSEADAKRVFDAMEYFASSMVLSQMIAKAFKLPAPDGHKCRYWPDHRSDGVELPYSKNSSAAFGEARDLFDPVALLPSEERHAFKQVRFWRSTRWLSAAIALRFKDAPPEEVKDFVRNEVARLVTKLRETQKNLLLKNEAVLQASQNWLAALGLGNGAGECDAAPSPVAQDTEIAEPTAEDIRESGRLTPVLDTEADEWEVNQADTVSGDGQNDNASAQGAESPNNSVAGVSETESHLDQNDLEHDEAKMDDGLYRPPHLRLKSEQQEVDVDAGQEKPDPRNLDWWRPPGSPAAEDEASVAQDTPHSQEQPVDTVVSPPRAADNSVRSESKSRHESSENDIHQAEEKKSNGSAHPGPARPPVDVFAPVFGLFGAEARAMADKAVIELEKLGAVGDDMVESLANILRQTADRLIHVHCKNGPGSKAGFAATDKMSNGIHETGEAGGPLKLRGGVSHSDLGAGEDGEPWGAHHAEAIAASTKDWNTGVTASNDNSLMDLLSDDVGPSPAMQSPVASFDHHEEDLLIDEDAESSEHLDESVYVDAPQEPVTSSGETEAPLVQLLEDDDFFARAGIKW